MWVSVHTTMRLAAFFNIVLRLTASNRNLMCHALAKRKACRKIGGKKYIYILLVRHKNALQCTSSAHVNTHTLTFFVVWNYLKSPFKMVHSITTQQKNHVSANTRQHIGSVCGGIHGQKKGPSAFSDPFQCVSSYKEDPQLRLQSGPCRRLLSHALRDEAKWQTQVNTFFCIIPCQDPFHTHFTRLINKAQMLPRVFTFFHKGKGTQ